jgi:ABC-2 type transport system permease protein
MKRVLSQCHKELAQFRRDRLSLGLAIFLPLVTLLIFGFVVRLEAKNISLVIQDLDNSSLSRSYIERLFATNQFQPTPWSGNDPVRDAVDLGLAKAAMIIPPEFSRQIKAGKESEVQVLVDGTDTNNARVIENSIKATTNFFLRNEKLIPGTDLVAAHVRIWLNPGRKEALYIVPGVYALVFWIFPSLLSAIAMVREKEKGTILQVYASSLTATEFILGKGLAYVLVGVAIATVVLILGSVIFQLGFAGDPTPFLISTPVFLWVSVTFGLLLGVRTSNQNAAVQGVALLGFLTAFLLSGFIYPLSNIPFPLSLIPNVVPARYYIEVARDVYVRGIGWKGVFFYLIALTVLGLIFFTIARRTLKDMQLPY